MGPTTPRELLLSRLARWHKEGLLDETLQTRLRADLDADAQPELDLPVAAAAPVADRRALATQWLHLVGGLLVGAGLVALAVFLDLDDDASGVFLVSAGLLGLGGAWLLQRRVEAIRPGLADAVYATALVALGVGTAMAGERIPGVILALAAIAGAVGTLFATRGRTPITAGAALVYTVAVLSSMRFFYETPEYAMVEGRELTAWLALVVFLGLLLLFRQRLWTEISLGLFVLPVTASFIGMLMAYEIQDDTTVQLVVGAYLGALLALGILVGSRGLVAGAAAGLVIDAVVFAFDFGGPLTAVLLLVGLGGLLVWQAEFLRSYFGRRRPEREGL